VTTVHSFCWLCNFGGLTVAGCQMLTQLLSPSPSTKSTGGENEMEKLLGQHQEGEITYQLLSWAKHTWRGR